MLEGLEKIEGLTDEQIENINSLAGGLVSKKDELLDKLNRVKSNSGASAAELEELRAFKESADIKAAEDSKKFDEAKRLIEERYQKQISEFETKNKELSSSYEKIVVDNALNAALDSAKVNPSLKDGASSMLRGKIEIVEGQAQIDNKPLNEYVAEWSESDQGKAYCLAPDNSGGGSNGGGNASPNQSTVEGRLKQRLKQKGLTT